MGCESFGRASVMVDSCTSACPNSGYREIFLASMSKPNDSSCPTATTTPASPHSPSPALPNQLPQKGAPLPHKISCTPHTSADGPRHLEPATSLPSPSRQSICLDTLRSSSQLLRQFLPCEKQSRFHRSHRNPQHPRN